jgi:hypothetical protein
MHMPKIDYAKRFRSRASKVLLTLLYGVNPELLRSSPWVVQTPRNFLYKKFRLSADRIDEIMEFLKQMGYVTDYQRTLNNQYICLLAMPAASLSDTSLIPETDLDQDDSEEDAHDPEGAVYDIQGESK